jgi:hypothetical protein
MAVLAFLKSDMFKYILFAALVGILLYKVYSAGEDHIQGKWDLEKAVVAEKIAELNAKAGKITTITQIKYLDKVRIVEGKGIFLTQYVDRYITKDNDAACIIPMNVVTLHDSAALNIVPKVAAAVTIPVEPQVAPIEKKEVK